MNEKINFQKLATLAATRLSSDAAETEQKLKLIFEEMSLELIERGETSLKDVGVFRVVGGEIIFTPSEAMADAVNAPFSMFEPVVLNDEVSDEILETAVATAPVIASEKTIETSDETLSDTESEAPVNEADTDSETVTIPDETEPMPAEVEPDTATIPESPSEGMDVPTPTTDSQSTVTENPTTYAVAEETTAEESYVEDEAVENDEESVYADNDSHDQTRLNWPMFWVGLIIGLALGVAACFFYVTAALTPTATTDVESPEYVAE